MLCLCTWHFSPFFSYNFDVYIAAHCKIDTEKQNTKQKKRDNPEVVFQVIAYIFLRQTIDSMQEKRKKKKNWANSWWNQTKWLGENGMVLWGSSS